MKAHFVRSFTRKVIVVLMAVQLLVQTAPSLAADAGDSNSSIVPAPAMPKHPVKKGPHKLKRIEVKLSFSKDPSDLELTSARVFIEPLIPLSGAKQANENQDLAKALLEYKSSGKTDSLRKFIESNPGSRWTPSLESSVASLLFEHGYLSKALKYWKAAWEASKKDNKGEQVANAALAELLLVHARVGHQSEVSALLKEAGTRKLQGSIDQKITGVREALGCMQRRPEQAFRCGPQAINSILGLKSKAHNAEVDKLLSSSSGTNCEQLVQLSEKVGLNYQVAKRSPGAPVIVPSVMHWKMDHFAAVVSAEGNGNYRLKDPTFGTNGTTVVSEDVLDTEADGYYLVARGSLPKGWRAVAQEETRKIWGKGVIYDTVQGKGSGTGKIPPAAGNGNGGTGSSGSGSGSGGGGCNGCCDNGADGANGDNGTTEAGPAAAAGSAPGNGGKGKPGMAAVSAFAMQAVPNITDTPLVYTPPIGPAVNIGLNYNYLESDQPSTFSFANLGQDWNFNWISYLTVDTSSNVTVRLSGGGSEYFAYPYYPSILSKATITNVGSGTYHRQRTDGTIEVFSQPDGSGRIFMTEIIDPRGNSALIQYDSDFRLITITDAIGQITTLSYLSNTIGDPGFYKISQVTDPFGRSCSFLYDSATTSFLMSITDVIGLTSSFAYETDTSFASFITQLTTPYGTTSIAHYYPHYSEGLAYGPTGLRFTFPDGSSSVLEKFTGEVGRTYFWDRHATAMYPTDAMLQDYSHAVTTLWLLETDTGVALSPIPYTNKLPLDNETTNGYTNQFTFTTTGHGSWESLNPGVESINNPTSVSVSTSGGTQTSSYTYNSIGNVTSAVDPLGRKFSYLYDSNQIDLLQKSESQGIDNSLLGKWTYDSKHNPLTYIDSSGNETDYAYNSFGELTTLTDALGDVTTMSYDSNGYLTQIDGPLPGSSDITTFSYDGYGRLYSVTDAEGYTIYYSYDDLNRVTQTTYPDGSTEQTVYNRLDAVQMKDRIGRWTTRSYDSMKQLSYEIDPLGRKTQYCWCLCGAMRALIDPAGNTTTWDHDLEGRVLTKTFPDGTEVNYTYDANGRLATRTDALGQVTTYAYNLDDSLSQVSYSSAVNATSTVNYSYDSIFPRMSTVANGWGTYTYEYNQFNELVLSGTTTPGDYVNVTIRNAALSGGKHNVQYQVQSGTTDNTLTKLATNVTSALNADSTLSAAGVSATSSGAVITAVGTGTVITGISTNGQVTETLSGTATTFDKYFITVYDQGLSGGSITFNTTVFGSINTLAAVATDLATQVNTNLTSHGITATSSGSALTITSTSVNNTTYSQQASAMATATITQTGGPTESGQAFVSVPGGNRLASVKNNVIANSDITYSYDALGRTTNRSINGSSNSDSWTYDAMSRVTSETNALGTWGYNYVDDSVPPFTIGGTPSGSRTETITINGHTASYVTSGGDTLTTIASSLASAVNGLSLPSVSASSTGAVISITAPLGSIFSTSTQGAITITGLSRGNSRLSSINYPNGQTTKFSYLPNIGEQRLQQILNLDPSSAMLSQFNYAYNAAGEITQWQQQQNSKNTHLGLEYDLAGQLVSANSDSGTSFDVYISGTASASETLSITAYDASLSSTTPVGQETATCSVNSGDTAAVMASNLASSINSSMNNIGVSASAAGSVVSINTSPNNATSFSTSRTGNGAAISVSPNSDNSYSASITGTPRTGDVVSVTAYDATLTGTTPVGQETASYTVASGNTAATVATNLASSINSAMGNLGISASAGGSSIKIIKNPTTFTCSPAGTSETISLVDSSTTSTTAYFKGIPTVGDVISITAYDPLLVGIISGGVETASYTVASGNSLSDVATGLASAMNTVMGSNLTLTATASGSNITFTHLATSTFTPVIAGATGTISLVNSGNVTTANIGGTPTVGVVVSVTAHNDLLTGTTPVGEETASYTVASGNSNSTIASSLASSINSAMSNINVSATASGSAITITAPSQRDTTFSASAPGNTETIALSAGTSTPGFLQQLNYAYDCASNRTSVQSNSLQTARIGGTKTTGDTITVTVNDSGLSGGSESVTYTVLSGDTLSSISAGLAAAITADANLLALGVNAVSKSNSIFIKSTSPNITTYSASKSSGATETITLGTYKNDNVNAIIAGTKTTGDTVTINFFDSGLSGGTEAVTYTVLSGDTLASITSSLAAAINADTNLQAINVSAASLGTAITLQSNSANRTTYRRALSSGATETISLQHALNGTQTAVVGGTKTTGDTVTVAVYDSGLSGGSKSISYVALSGDNLAAIAAGLAAAVNADSSLSTIGVSATSVGQVLNLTSVSLNNTSYAQSTSAGATETISLGNAAGVTQAAFNNVNELTGLSPGGAVKFQGTSVNPIKSASANVSQTATISGTMTAGDKLWIIAHDKGLSKAEPVKYVVQSGDSATNAATGLKNAINADSVMSGLGITATSSGAVLTISASSSSNATRISSAKSSGATETITLGTVAGSVAKESPSTVFSGNTVLATGTNTTAITAVSGGGTASTMTLPVNLASGSSSTLSYDLNGNMLSDGTNSYAWDVENRLIKLTYPGTNNYSTFTFDGLGRNVTIAETRLGAITNTKQFVWCGNERCESRDNAGALTSQFLKGGEVLAGTSYYFTKDHPGNTSIREIIDASGNLKTVYTYTPFGQATKTFISGTIAADFQYGGYYFHEPSGLNLTRTRAYSAMYGRFISRDPIAENGGLNLYGYGLNSPVRYIDPLGLDVAIVVTPRYRGFPGFGHCGILVGSEANGWTYLSNSLGGDSSSGKTYKNLSEFYAAWQQDYSRDRTSWFPKGPGDTMGARAGAQSAIDKGYNIRTNNCAHACRDALRGAGIDMPEGGANGTGDYLTPSEVFDNSKAAGGVPPPQ